MNKKIIRLSLIAFLIASLSPIRADEGMWLPFLLKEQEYKEMKKLGLKIPADRIYSDINPCIANSIVGFMGENAGLQSYGTGSFISREGLVITNYHVIMSFLERLSESERDFLRYGYFASDRSEETWCRGLELKQFVRMEDVTDRITEGTAGLSGKEYSDKINENGIRIAKEVKASLPDSEVKMQTIFAGNRYIMNVYLVFKDIRMVFAPPFQIARFGLDKDNYRWPRQCGDFAILRVYAGKGNKPARHSEANVPYKPTYHLTISGKGVKEGDFTMLLGFPGNTKEYIPSYALDKIINEERAAGISIKKGKMEILQDAIKRNPENRFRYSAKLSSVSNSYLRWKGEMEGVISSGLIDIKKKEEEDFNKWANADSSRTIRYGNIIEQLNAQYDSVSAYNMAAMYFQETGLNGAEIVPFIGKFEKMAAMYKRKTLDSAAIKREADRLQGLTGQFFGKWDYVVDRDIFKMMLFHYYTGTEKRFISSAMTKYITKYNGDIDQLVDEAFRLSMLTHPDSIYAFLSDKNRDFKTSVTDDMLYQLAISFYQVNVDLIVRQRSALQSRQAILFKQYIQGVLEMEQSSKKRNHLYPDANGSLRVAFGKVKGVDAKDGVRYLPFTHTSGIIRKSILKDDDYSYPVKLRESYITNQDSPVNFLTDTHTTSGNSGSPLLNSKGEFIGICFDRIWEGICSDYRYDPALSRAIAVDSRYILSIIQHYQKYTKYILNELSNQ